MDVGVSEREKDRIRNIAGLLHQACRSVRVLRSLEWSPEVKAAFFAGGAKELPQVSYNAVDPTPAASSCPAGRSICGWTGRQK